MSKNRLKEARTQTSDTKKIAVISVLMITSIAIVLLGGLFITGGLLYGTSFTVMNSKINGAVFGLVIAFLGVRYLLAVLKLKNEVYKTSSKFAWSNFKRAREGKSGN